MDDIRAVSKKDIAELFKCGLCGGIIVEASSLPECPHVFCKSCIVNHCQNVPANCPLKNCGAEIHASKPLQHLKNDASLQTLINKFFPDVYLDEMERRRLFFDEYCARRDISMTRYSGEQIGVSANHHWLRSVPKLLQVSVEYDLELSQDDLCIQPARFCKKIHVMLVSSTCLVGKIRKLICAKHDIKKTEQFNSRKQQIDAIFSSDVSLFNMNSTLYEEHFEIQFAMVVILHANTLVGDEYQVEHFLRFGMVEGGDTIHLKYCFVDLPSHYDAVSREAALRKMIHRRPLISVAPVKTEPVEPEIALAHEVPVAGSVISSTSDPLMDASDLSSVVSSSNDHSTKGCTGLSQSSLPLKKRRYTPDVSPSVPVKQNTETEAERTTDKILEALLLKERDSESEFETETQIQPLFPNSVISVSYSRKKFKYQRFFPPSPKNPNEPRSPVKQDKGRIVDEDDVVRSKLHNPGTMQSAVIKARFDTGASRPPGVA